MIRFKLPFKLRINRQTLTSLTLAVIAGTAYAASLMREEQWKRYIDHPCILHVDSEPIKCRFTPQDYPDAMTPAKLQYKVGQRVWLQFPRFLQGMEVSEVKARGCEVSVERRTYVVEVHALLKQLECSIVVVYK